MYKDVNKLATYIFVIIAMRTANKHVSSERVFQCGKIECCVAIKVFFLKAMTFVPEVFFSIWKLFVIDFSIYGSCLLSHCYLN